MGSGNSAPPPPPPSPPPSPPPPPQLYLCPICGQYHITAAQLRKMIMQFFEGVTEAIEDGNSAMAAEQLEAIENPQSIPAAEASQVGKNGVAVWKNYIENNTVDDPVIAGSAAELAELEGYYFKLYKCQAGKPTVGFGNMTESAYTKEALKKMGYSETQVDSAKKVAMIAGQFSTKQHCELFVSTLKICKEELKRIIPGFNQLPVKIQEGFMVNIYKSGMPGLKKNTALMEAAASQAKNSKDKNKVYAVYKSQIGDKPTYRQKKVLEKFRE